MKDKRPSPKVASDAGRMLQNPQSTAKEKELAASILANREPKQVAHLTKTLIALNRRKGR